MSMRWTATMLMLASGMLVLGRVGAFAAEAAPETLTGEVVDMACYVVHPATSHGNGHRKCADTCLKKGMPMGILTDDKQVILVLEDHENPKPYAQLKEKAAEKVTIEGDRVTQGGLQGIVVQTVK